MNNIGLTAHLSLQEQALFAKRLSLLVKANVPILSAIKILEQQATSGRNRKMLEHISRDIANGQSLHKSLARFQKIFGDFAITIIRVGETSGTLYESLKYLTEEIDKRRRLRQKIAGALVYPVVIMAAALALSGLMIMYLFPKLLPVFKSLNVRLPVTTRALLWVSDFLINYWAWLILALAALIVAFLFLMRLTPCRLGMHKVSLRLPIVGALLQHYYLTSLCRTLGILFKSQVRVLEAVTVAADTAPNLVYRKALQNLHHSVTKGGTIAKHFEKHPRLFPSMLSQMVAIGEATGNVSDTLIYLSEIYEEELDEQTKRLSSVIEPIMMLGMGLLVGFIAISIITPIYEVTQHLTPR